MAIVYNAEDFIGGGDALDGYDGADLLDGMKAAVFSPDSFAPYILDDDSAAGETPHRLFLQMQTQVTNVGYYKRVFSLN